MGKAGCKKERSDKGRHESPWIRSKHTVLLGTDYENRDWPGARRRLESVESLQDRRAANAAFGEIEAGLRENVVFAHKTNRYK